MNIAGYAFSVIEKKIVEERSKIMEEAKKKGTVNIECTTNYRGRNIITGTFTGDLNELEVAMLVDGGIFEILEDGCGIINEGK